MDGKVVLADLATLARELWELHARKRAETELKQAETRPESHPATS